jgi:hypothetical protein
MRAGRLPLPTSPEECGWAASAGLLAPLVEASLALGGLDRTLRWIERLPRGAPGVVPLTVAASARAVGRAYRLQPWLRGRCLARALVQHTLHRLCGTPAKLLIGVRRRAGEPLEAHAWIDAPAGMAEAHGYQPLLMRDALA